MIRPIIVWTMRRSGGTALAPALAEFFERHTTDEPFNRDRPFGHITRALREGASAEDVRPDIEDAVDSVDFLKHCIDFLPIALHEELLAVTVARGWTHLVLERRNKVARALSLEMAIQTGIWGQDKDADDTLLQSYLSGEKTVGAFDADRCQNALREHRRRSRWLSRRLQERSVPHHRLVFERIYKKEPVSEWAPPLMDFIGARDAGRAEFIAAMSVQRESGGQGTRALYAQVPNIKEVRKTLQRLAT